MNTDDLIRIMAAEAPMRGPSLAGRLSLALMISGAVAATLLVLGIGVRPDIASALQTWRFDAKLAVTILCFGLALWACLQLTRPETGVRDVLPLLAVAAAVLAILVAYELMSMPRDDWLPRAIGSNSRLCLASIPILALAPLVAVLAVLRAGAPSSPAAAGAVAGLLAGALGATLYATHCVDDSPLFVALWYVPAVALVVLAGALAGHRLLRW
jgi:hypothetical protein